MIELGANDEVEMVSDIERRARTIRPMRPRGAAVVIAVLLAVLAVATTVAASVL